MKNKLFCVGGVIVIIGCFALSYFIAERHGRQFIGEAFPIEIHHQLPAQSLGEHDIENVLRVFSMGIGQTRLTVDVDDLATFAVTHQILEQIALLQENEILPAGNFEPLRSASLLRYSLDGYADVYVWQFSFSSEIGGISVVYHPVTQRIIHVWDGNEIKFSLQ